MMQAPRFIAAASDEGATTTQAADDCASLLTYFGLLRKVKSRALACSKVDKRWTRISGSPTKRASNSLARELKISASFIATLHLFCNAH